jgi:hypothetical protein
MDEGDVRALRLDLPLLRPDRPLPTSIATADKTALDHVMAIIANATWECSHFNDYITTPVD